MPSQVVVCNVNIDEGDDDDYNAHRDNRFDKLQIQNKL